MKIATFLYINSYLGHICYWCRCSVSASVLFSSIAIDLPVLSVNANGSN